jgi:hypothetical protein
MLKREDFARIKWLMENASKKQLEGIIRKAQYLLSKRYG